MAMEFDADMIVGLGYFVSGFDPIEPTFSVACFSPDETKEARLLLSPTDLAAGAAFSLGNGFFDLLGMGDTLTWAGNEVWDAGNFTPGALAFLNSVDNSNWSGTDLSVANGGTGASTLTGYVKGSGTSALTASATIPSSDITGLGSLAALNSINDTNWVGADLSVINGGTGSGGFPVGAYLKGDNTNPIAWSLTIPNTDITGLGTLSTLSSINNSNWSGTDLSVLNGGTGASDAATARSNLGLPDGTYTPTLTPVANVAATSSPSGMYSRVGNTVTVSVVFAVDPTTASVTTQVGISLPIASALTSAAQVSGTGACIQAWGRITGDATNDRAELQFNTADVANRTWGCTFQYQVI